MKNFLLISILLLAVSCDNTTNVNITPVVDPWKMTDYWSEDDWDAFGTGPRVFFEDAMINIAPYPMIFDIDKGIQHIALPGETIEVEFISYNKNGAISNQDTDTITFDYLGRVKYWYGYNYSYNSNNLIKSVENTSSTNKDLRKYFYDGENITTILRYSGDYLWDSLSFQYADNAVTRIKYSTSDTYEFGLKDSLIYKSDDNLGYVNTIVGWSYDSDNSAWFSESSTVIYEFDLNGQLIMKDYGYVYWRYSYDINGKMEKYQIGDSDIYEIKYDTNGNITSRNKENVSKKEYLYDTLSNYPFEMRDYLFDDTDSTYYLSEVMKIKRNL